MEYSPTANTNTATKPMTSAKDDPNALNTLLQELLSSEEPISTRIEAANQLAEIMEPQSLNALLQVLHEDTEPRLVMHLISLVGRHKIVSAVMPLVDILLCTGETLIEKESEDFPNSDVGVRIRIAAARSLGQMGDDRAIVPLMSLLNNPNVNYRIRLTAAESLGRLGDDQALNPLIDIVYNDEEPSQYLKESAVKALGMLGDMRALDPLINMFESKKGIKGKFQFLKEQVIEAIGRIGSQNNRAQDTLLTCLKDETAYIRLAAIESLAEVGDDDTIPHIKECLFDPDDDVAMATVATLYQLGGETLIRDILSEQENLPQFIRDELESYVP